MGRRIEAVAGLAALAFLPSPARGAQPQLNVPAGRLGTAIVTLSGQLDVTIGLVDQSLAPLATHRVSGRMDAAEALARLLAGTGARARKLAGSVWRIERRPATRMAPPLRPAPAPAAIPGPAVPEVVVTASKRDTPQASYPGAFTVVTGDALSPTATALGTEALLARVPILGSTELGPGRNKLFIRGIADSSFNGPTQSTIGQYLGDVRLTYNAPDPDLALYDVRSVEILEGPQGTLYGAGSLGGIIRIVPQPPQLGQWAGAVDGGLSLRARGGDAWDMSGLVNVPLGSRAAMRVVGFRSSEGGYIDDAGRGLGDVNTTHMDGGRAALRIEPGGGWSIELGGAIQNVFSRDGQYAERGLPPFTRRTALAQPFDNDYALGSVVVSRQVGASRFVSATALVRQSADVAYDFTDPGGTPTLYRQRNVISLLSNETRLSRQGPDGSGWIIGASLLHDAETLDRSLGPPDAPVQILGVANRVTAAALFGEAGLRLARNLVLTGGSRVEYENQDGEPRGPTGERMESRRDKVEWLPSVALLWRPADTAKLWIRYQEGYRPGGLSIGQEGTVQRFRGDGVATTEIGAGTDERRRLAGSITLSHVLWRRIQADLVDGSGLPYTANVGTGRIWAAELNGQWRPVQRLRFQTSLLFNDGRLTGVAPAAGDVGDALPNLARWGGFWEAVREVPWGRASLEWRGSVRYVGRSRLGIGDTLDLAQGDYTDVAAGLALRSGGWRLSLDVTNLFDVAGNRFALGDPHTVALGRQVVPLRPRSVRIGGGFSF